MPLDEILDFLLIFDGSQLTKHSNAFFGRLMLPHLEDNGFVAVELLAMAY